MYSRETIVFPPAGSPVATTSAFYPPQEAPQNILRGIYAVDVVGFPHVPETCFKNDPQNGYLYVPNILNYEHQVRRLFNKFNIKKFLLYQYLSRLPLDSPRFCPEKHTIFVGPQLTEEDVKKINSFHQATKIQIPQLGHIVADPFAITSDQSGQTWRGR